MSFEVNKTSSVSTNGVIPGRTSSSAWQEDDNGHLSSAPSDLSASLNDESSLDNGTDEMVQPLMVSQQRKRPISDFANVFKAFIGSNYLSVPFAFARAGTVLGLVLLVFVAVATDFCCNLIVVCKRKAVSIRCSQLSTDGQAVKREEVEKHFQYGDIGEIVWGHYGRVAVDVALLVTQTGFCIGYCIFLGNTLSTLIGVDTTYCIIMFYLPFLLLSLVRNVRSFGSVSMLANLSLLIGFFVVLSQVCIELKHPPKTALANWRSAPVFFGIITSSYEGIGTIIPIESSMTGNRQAYTGYLHWALFLVSAILGGFGAMGYSAYGSSVDQIIISELPVDSVLPAIVRATLIIGISCTFPLQFFPVVQISEKWLRLSQTPRPVTFELQTLTGSSQSAGLSPLRAKNIVIRVLLMFLVVGIAVLAQDNFSYVSSFTGALGSTALSFIYPCLFQLQLFKGNMSRAHQARNWGVIAFGLVGGITAIYSTIESLAA